jgi:sugar/nucleoside kinase (ribokinase family)
MPQDFDAIICGSCVVDVLVRPVPLDSPIGGGQLVRTEPLLIATGGIVSNSGITLARLGMRAAAFTYVGNDEWASIIRARYADEGIDASHLVTHDSAPTSTTAVLIDPSGERSFLHAVGAPKLLDKQVFLANMPFFARGRVTLLGYYSLLPNLQNDLAEVLAAIRQTGCQTALDAAGDGGSMEPLAECLPHLDYYVPSFKEASHQTGEDDPQRIIAAYRSAGAPGLLGVKLGTDGALLSPSAGEFIEISPVKPPGEVVDTTGAGDCFYGGLLAGILRGMSFADAGKLAAAAGACCVTGLGATSAIRGYEETARLAGLH